MKVDAALTRQTADIKRAYFEKSELQRGETVSLKIVLKPFGQPEVTKTIPVEVPPATDTLRYLVITVMGGDSAPPDVAPPDSLADLVRGEFRLPTHFNASRLGAFAALPSRSVAVLPQSALSHALAVVLTAVVLTAGVLTAVAGRAYLSPADLMSQ